MSDDNPMEISVHEFDALRRSDEALTILDVRNPPEIAVCAFDGSLNIPMHEIPANLQALPRDGKLIVVCHHGARSLQVAAWLRHNGRDNAISLRGGVDAWSRQIDPSMPRY
jgi:rhodanese-related sulfurtransferase